MKPSLMLSSVVLLTALSAASSYTFTPRHCRIVEVARLANKDSSSRHTSHSQLPTASAATSSTPRSFRRRAFVSLQMVDQNYILGGAIAAGGLALGIGLVAFTEAQGERAKQRGGGLSDTMTTRIASGLIEDVEVSSVADLGSLTSQLEKALKEGGADIKEVELSEQEKKRRATEADDGW